MAGQIAHAKTQKHGIEFVSRLLERNTLKWSKEFRLDKNRDDNLELHLRCLGFSLIAVESHLKILNKVLI